jgi:glycosyltransferase involved in cell wall biosynthesis
MIRDRVLVCFSTISWDYLWQRHQEFMSRFARAGNRVLFVEPIGIRMPKWEDRARILARLRNRTRAGARGVRPVMENVWALDPLVNPLQQFDWIHRRNVAALTAQLQNALAQVGGEKVLAWTYAPTPLAREVIARLRPQLVIYDCVDAYSENPKGVFAWYAESERALVREADLVLTTSPQLHAQHQPANPHTYYLPAGVHYDQFAEDTLPEPAALQNIPPPRLVFFGGIDERVDLDALTRVARSHPEWQLVLLGVVRTNVAALARMPNVHFLGQIAHDALPAFLHHADALLLPYVRTVFSHYIQPAKLFECLATGKPIVASGLPLFDAYRDMLYVASNGETYADWIEKALTEKKDAPEMAKRRACARANTWDVRFQELNRLLEERLAEISH